MPQSAKAQAPVDRVLKLLKRQYPHSRYYLNFETPLELMVAAILSAQVRDEVVNATTPRLFKKYRSAKDYARAELKTLVGDIKGITFAGNKAAHIKQACRILLERYKGEVPDRFEDLVKLPGIGPKTANAILINAFGKVVGIVVDTHVIRLSTRLGWTRQRDPKKIEQELMQIVPKEEWARITWLLKDHGRAVCKAPTPTCQPCILNPLCPKLGV